MKEIQQEQSGVRQQEAKTPIDSQANQLFVSSDEHFRCSRIRSVMLTLTYQLFIVVVTIIASCNQAVSQTAFTPKQNPIFDSIQITIMVIFILQVILSSLCLKDYLFSFFFWMDLLSALSSVLDISSVQNVIENQQFSIENNVVTKSGQNSKASNAATRMVKILKLLRLLRVIKLYKSAVKAKEVRERAKKSKPKKTARNKTYVETYAADESAQTADCIAAFKVAPQPVEQPSSFYQVNENAQSRLSKILSNLTLKKVMLSVLIISIAIPMFDTTVYTDNPKYTDLVVNTIAQALEENRILTEEIIQYSANIQAIYNQDYAPIILFSTPFVQIPQFTSDINFQDRFQDSFIVSSRQININEIVQKRNLTVNQTRSKFIVAVADNEYNHKQECFFDMARLGFVGVVISLLLYFFDRDTNILIIRPIEDMTERVRNVVKNPNAPPEKLVADSQFQTALVQNTLIQISNLLSIVFGCAGAQIIGNTMVSQGSLNLMTNGKKKCIIYGVCSLKNFLEVTEVLQQDILILLNTIAQIVHSSAFKYGGDANQNTGQRLILIWSIPDNKYAIDQDDGNSIIWLDDRYVSVLCDFAIFSSVNSIAKLHRQPIILRHRKDQRLLQRFGCNYEIDMNIGLHIGWAIQGAVGSQFKIDICYTSPHVTTAHLMLEASRLYGVNLIISQSLCRICSPELKSMLRMVDNVYFELNRQEIKLYTLDINLKFIQKFDRKAICEDEDIEIKRDLNLEFLNEEIEFYSANSFIESNQQLKKIIKQQKNIEEFRKMYELGVEQYLRGTWTQSEHHLKAALKLRPQDCASRFLLQRMSRLGVHGKVPRGWRHRTTLTHP